MIPVEWWPSANREQSRSPRNSNRVRSSAHQKIVYGLEKLVDAGKAKRRKRKRPSAVDIPFSRAITGGTGGRLRKARGMATQTYVGTNATGVPNATFRLKVVVGAAGGS